MSTGFGSTPATTGFGSATGTSLSGGFGGFGSTTVGGFPQTQFQQQMPAVGCKLNIIDH